MLIRGNQRESRGSTVDVSGILPINREEIVWGAQWYACERWNDIGTRISCNLAVIRQLRVGFEGIPGQEVCLQWDLGIERERREGGSLGMCRDQAGSHVEAQSRAISQ